MLTASQVPDQTWLDQVEFQGYEYIYNNYLQGSGSSDDPYLIETPEQLALLAYDSALAVQGHSMSHKITQNYSYFKQTANIDLGGYEWIAIPRFTGIYDGGGYTISGLISGHITYKTQRIISSDNNVGLGLFGEITDTARIKNVNIKNSVIFSDPTASVTYSVGGLCSRMIDESYIENCCVAMYINLTQNLSRMYYVGGIVGYAQGSEIYINDSTFIGTIFIGEGLPTFGSVGGIMGEARDATPIEIAGSNFDGEIICNSTSYVGGILGQADGDITLSGGFVKGVLQSKGCAGAVVGLVYDRARMFIYLISATATLIGQVGSTIFTGSYCQPEELLCQDCSFVGYFDKSNIDPSFDPIYDAWEFGYLKSCYAVFNGYKYAWFDDPAAFAESWRLVPNINGGLPIQRALYSVANVVPRPTAYDVMDWFEDFECVS